MKRLLICTAFVFFYVSNVNATLIDRGGGLIYDSYLDVTWLQDANYANTIGYDDSLYGFDTNGAMTWQDAKDWAQNLTYYDSVRDIIWSEWRLPEVPANSLMIHSFDGSTVQGWNNTSTEMSHIYYSDLGNTGRYDTFGSELDPYGFVNSGLFLNIQSQSADPARANGDAYWYGTPYILPGWDRAWYFRFDVGYQDTTSYGYSLYAWAVMDGDVGAAPVPEPASVFLLGTGLIGVFGSKIIKSNKGIK